MPASFRRTVLPLLACTCLGLDPAAAQPLDMTQAPKHSFETEIVSMPISVVKGHGIYNNIELMLRFDSGTFSLVKFSTVIDFKAYYALRTATTPAKCLEGKDTGNHSLLATCSDVTGMRWRFVERPSVAGEDIYFWLQNDHSSSLGVCLTDNVSNGARRVSMETCDAASRKQLWKLLPSTNGFFTIAPSPSLGAQECLDGFASSRGTAVVAPCNQTGGQMWYFGRPTDSPGFVGRWNTNFGSMMISQKDNTITGTYPAENGASVGRITGTVRPWAGKSFRVDGTWSERTGSGSIVWIVSEDNSHWRGNYGGSSAWCGWRDDAVQPNPCLLIP